MLVSRHKIMTISMVQQYKERTYCRVLPFVYLYSCLSLYNWWVW